MDLCDKYSYSSLLLAFGSGVKVFKNRYITESVLQNIDKTIKVLNDLRALGIQIEIDDFGTDYSSLSYLKNLPVSCLKIDKSFIEELSDNIKGPIVKTIIGMGRNMDFTVISDGVESNEHVAFFRKNHCYVG